MGARISAVSLGQGQGAKAATLVAEGANVGSWVVLQVRPHTCAHSRMRVHTHPHTCK